MISILISTYHSKTLCYVLEKLKEQTYKDFEVIICDDGSNDFGLINKKKYPYLLKYVWHPDIGRTWSWNHNEGIALARGEYILFLHDDIIPSNNLLELFVSYLKKFPNAIVSGVRDTIPRTKKAIKNPDKFKTIIDHRLIINDELFCRFGINVNYQNQIIDLSTFLNNSYQMVSGCIMAMPTKVVREIGGCAEDYPGWGFEDHDLALRLKRKGLKILLALNARGFHLIHDELEGAIVKKNKIEFSKREKDNNYINNFNYPDYVKSIEK